MHHPEVADRLAILNAAHPRKLSQGLHHPGQLRKSWYFFFFALPELPESVVHANHWHFFRNFVDDAHPAYTPEEIDRYVEAWIALSACPPRRTGCITTSLRASRNCSSTSSPPPYQLSTAECRPAQTSRARLVATPKLDGS